MSPYPSKLQCPSVCLHLIILLPLLVDSSSAVHGRNPGTAQLSFLPDDTGGVIQDVTFKESSETISTKVVILPPQENVSHEPPDPSKVSPNQQEPPDPQPALQTVKTPTAIPPLTKIGQAKQETDTEPKTSNGTITSAVAQDVTTTTLTTKTKLLTTKTTPLPTITPTSAMTTTKTTTITPTSAMTTTKTTTITPTSAMTTTKTTTITPTLAMTTTPTTTTKPTTTSTTYTTTTTTTTTKTTLSGLPPSGTTNMPQHIKGSSSLATTAAMPPPYASSTRPPPDKTAPLSTVPAARSACHQNCSTTPLTNLNQPGAQVTKAAVVDVMGAPLSRQLVDTVSLLAVLLFGLLFFLVTVAVFVAQAYESYRRRDYTQVDYLINGMYTDSGV